MLNYDHVAVIEVGLKYTELAHQLNKADFIKLTKERLMADNNLSFYQIFGDNNIQSYHVTSDVIELVDSCDVY